MIFSTARRARVAIAIVSTSVLQACSSSTVATTPAVIPTSTPDMYKSFGNGVTISIDGTDVVLRSNGLPDHKSPYFGTGDAKFEAYNGNNTQFALNPNRIVEQTLVFRIPITPTRLATPSATPLGPIGISTNGVPLFNQYAGNNQPLTGEINSFDQYAGHPQQTGQYHYHVEPTYLTRVSRDALIGVLLDGYPVYGPLEDGKLVTTASLDAAHGHTGVTKDFPAGIYHYHTSSDAPYINGSGFAGVPGTVGR